MLKKTNSKKRFLMKLNPQWRLKESQMVIKNDRGKRVFRRNIAEREKEYSQFKEEFGHIKGDTAVRVYHKCFNITLVECLLRIITTLEPVVRREADSETTMYQ